MTSIATLQSTRKPGAPWPILDAAAHLSISDRHLRRLIDEKKIAVIRYGRRIMIADAEMSRISNEGTGN